LQTDVVVAPKGFDFTKPSILSVDLDDSVWDSCAERASSVNAEDSVDGDIARWSHALELFHAKSGRAEEASVEKPRRLTKLKFKTVDAFPPDRNYTSPLNGASASWWYSVVSKLSTLRSLYGRSAALQQWRRTMGWIEELMQKPPDLPEFEDQDKQWELACFHAHLLQLPSQTGIELEDITDMQEKGQQYLQQVVDSLSPVLPGRTLGSGAMTRLWRKASLLCTGTPTRRIPNACHRRSGQMLRYG